MKGCILNIQKFSIHDGPGIRTVVFFKGCPLRCPWCSNPESQNFEIQVTADSKKCTRCLTCVRNNKSRNIELINNQIIVRSYDSNENYLSLCPNNAFQVDGSYSSVESILSDIMKDIDFYEESNGGVTLSGGEVLSQADFACHLIDAIKEKNIHVAIETTGFSSLEIFKKVIKNVDLLLYDMKHYDCEKHATVCGVPNEQILENMRYAIEIGKDLIARIPVIPGFNNTLEDAENFSILLKEIGVKKVNLLPFHQFGLSKYERLGLNYPMKDVHQLHSEDLQEYQKIMQRHGLECTF